MNIVAEIMNIPTFVEASQRVCLHAMIYLAAVGAVMMIAFKLDKWWIAYIGYIIIGILLYKNVGGLSYVG